MELDGLQVQARWDDGDTFSAYTTDGETKKKIKARMNGYNTLESYGPVHSWGTWSTQELYVLAKESGVVAQKGTWKCSDLKRVVDMVDCWSIVLIYAPRYSEKGMLIHSL